MKTAWVLKNGVGYYDDSLGRVYKNLFYATFYETKKEAWEVLELLNYKPILQFPCYL